MLEETREKFRFETSSFPKVVFLLLFSFLLLSSWLPNSDFLIVFFGYQIAKIEPFVPKGDLAFRP